MIADRLVGRRASRTAGVADLCTKDSIETPEPGVRTPKSAKGKGEVVQVGGTVEIDWGGHERVSRKGGAAPDTDHSHSEPIGKGAALVVVSFLANKIVGATGTWPLVSFFVLIVSGWISE